jgi:hypothetical protein
VPHASRLPSFGRKSCSNKGVFFAAGGERELRASIVVSFFTRTRGLSERSKMRVPPFSPGISHAPQPAFQATVVRQRKKPCRCDFSKTPAVTNMRAVREWRHVGRFTYQRVVRE